MEQLRAELASSQQAAAGLHGTLVSKEWMIAELQSHVCVYKAPLVWLVQPPKWLKPFEVPVNEHPGKLQMPKLALCMPCRLMSCM
jgi:hypothetical protein